MADGKNAGDVPDRRRIEIRLRRSNRAVVVDGDTIRLNNRLIRLFGIDAPEAGDDCQRSDGTRWDCGKAATEALRRALAGKSVSCRAVDRDRFGRTVSVCVVEGKDISCEMARKGLAVDWPVYSKGQYADCQAHARASKIGVWDSQGCQPFMIKRKHAGCN